MNIFCSTMIWNNSRSTRIIATSAQKAIFNANKFIFDFTPINLTIHKMRIENKEDRLKSFSNHASSNKVEC